MAAPAAPTQNGAAWRNAIVGYGEEPPDALLAHPANPKIHPKGQQDALGAAISELGWLAPVIVNQQTQHVLDGHARIGLAISRGEPSVPVAYVDLPAEHEALALATFDPIGSMAVHDRDALEALLADVRTDDAALEGFLTGLAQREGVSFGPPPPVDLGPEVDRAAELQEKWQTARGQLWVIGRHRLLCGDATDAGGAARLFAGARPRLLVTDPPYGVDYDPRWRDAAQAVRLGRGRKAIAHGDDTPKDWTAALDYAWLEVAYCWAPPGAQQHLTQLMLEAAGYAIRQQVVWVKPMAPLSRSAYHWRHEPCWYAVRPGAQAGWIGGHAETTVWEAPSPTHIMSGSTEEATPHATQKPLECMARPIRNHQGDVYDPFVGSGTTLVAAEQLGRRGYAMDVAPQYVAVTLERLAGMGLTPRLEAA